jgi:hypothetical protein
MKQLNPTKILLYAAIIILALSVVLAVIALFPEYTGTSQSNLLVNDTFTLTTHETYRQGLGSFRGGENVSVLIQSPSAFLKNFSLMTYNGSHYTTSSQSDIHYSFIASADYYDAVFVSNSSTAGIVHFQASVQESKAQFPCSWLAEPAKIMFIVSLTAVVLTLLIIVFSNFPKLKPEAHSTSSFSKNIQRYLPWLIVLSLVIWLLLLAVNTNPLATFEGWYTDNARHTYTSSLFLKDGFSVFSQPLGTLANVDNSSFKFVTWPEMPHLYPLGSIFLFLPFGILTQNGLAAVLSFKLEIVIFLVFAHICLYFFLKTYLKKNWEEPKDGRSFKSRFNRNFLLLL